MCLLFSQSLFLFCFYHYCVVIRWCCDHMSNRLVSFNIFIFGCICVYTFGVDLGAPFFPGGHELWHHPLAYSAAAAAELPSAALQHATLVHPALHPQVPVRSYLWLNPEKMIDQPMHQVSSLFKFIPFYFQLFI